jgi:hypothetical protein
LIAFIFVMVFLSACTKEPERMQEPIEQKPGIEKQKPDSFVFCIDNSRSIKGEEKVLIRETAMLLADLAEKGDRVSIITFGKDAREVLKAVIISDEDRIQFKKQVNALIGFDESFSDIRAGLSVLAAGEATAANMKEYRQHCIFLSDGKLEPADKKTGLAFEQMKQLIESRLAGFGIYAVVLGDTSCNDIILPDVDGKPLTGKRLMEKFVASSPDHFFHARKLDQLLPITVDILNKTKGSSAIGQDPASTQFRIDSSVDTMTLVIKKRSIDGVELCNSSDIQLYQPESNSPAQTTYRSNDYRYFDLIVVRNPAEGNWSLSLKNNKIPEVLSKIVTPVQLRYDIRDGYFLNESALCRAWLFDASKSRIASGQTFQIKAHLAKEGDMKQSQTFVDLHTDQQSGQFFIDMPREVLEKVSGNSPRIQIELIAQRLKLNSSELDPWFVRRSPVLTIAMKEPFIEWVSPAQNVIKWPFFDTLLSFGAFMDTAHKEYPRFQTPPKLQFALDYYAPNKKAYESIKEIKLESTLSEKRMDFKDALSLGAFKKGTYRYRYQLADSILENGGPFSFKSPDYFFHVHSYSFDTWQFWAICGTTMFFLLCLLSSLTARMQGTISTDGMAQMINGKSYESELIFRNCFNLKAKKLCFFWSYTIMKVTAGSVTVSNITMINVTIPAGKEIKLSPLMQHTIVQNEGDRIVKRILMVNV